MSALSLYCHQLHSYTILCLHVFLCLVWFGVIFIRSGLYQDGVFKFTIYIPDNYPDGDCPVSCEFVLALKTDSLNTLSFSDIGNSYSFTVKPATIFFLSNFRS